ncbi:hypothetical protein D3C72_1766380 [compost metagenome]
MGTQAHDGASLRCIQLETFARRAQLFYLGQRHLHFGPCDIGFGLCISQLLRGFIQAVRIRGPFADSGLPACEHGLELGQPRGLCLLASLGKLPFRFGYGEVGA